MCDCPGREFGSHVSECPERNGKYAMRYQLQWAPSPRAVAIAIVGTVVFVFYLAFKYG